jgi:hypothetical protein
MIKRLGFFSLLIIVLSGCSQSHLEIFPELSSESVTTQALSVEQMHADIEALYQGVLARHPDLDRYADQAVLEQAVADLKQQVAKPMNRTGFYRIVGQLSHRFNDGHSFLIWPHQEYQALKEQGHKPFPFSIEINQEGVFTKHHYEFAGETISAGSRLVSINGQDIRDMVEFAQRFVGGETRALREQVVAERFGLMLWSVFDQMDDFNLVLEDRGREFAVNITPEQNWQSTEDTEAKDFYFKETQPGVGMLYVGHFDVDPGWFEDFIDESMARAKALGVEKLIIDIRDNPGGNTDTAAYLVSYIADKPFRMVSELKEKLNEDNRGIFNYKGEPGDLLQEEWEDYIDPQKPAVRFEGEVYLLIGEITYSSAIVLATTVKDYNMATLVGQQTGGFANQTGQGNLFSLPNSELRAYVPTRLLLRPSGDTAVRGVIPHVITRPTRQHLIDGVDTEIDAVLAMVGD